MSKLESTKSQLIRTSVIAGGIVFVLVAAMLMVMSMEESTIDERQRVTREINNVNADIQRLDQTFKKARQSLDLYQRLQSGDGKADSSLDRKEITAALNLLKDKYKLDSLTLRMTPVIELKDEQFITTTTKVIKTELTMTFAGMTDELLLGFIKDLQAVLPGYARITFLQMKRDGIINNNFLLSVNQETYPALVSGEVTLQLMGLKKFEAEKTS